uniref:Uncharacterized protein n=1 Tax=Acrobeloides nanus TaxID=290746 RepID=A0A914CVI3_9BILA
MVKSPFYWLVVFPYRTILNPRYRYRPTGSEVLSAYIRQREYPPWTSYFVPYKYIQDDQWSQKNYNFDVDGQNYQILRVGCWPYIKYHCTKKPVEDVSKLNKLLKFMTIINFGGLPFVVYGVYSILLISHTDYVVEPRTGIRVPIHFHIKENW